jgi:hypothetical protein
MEKISLKYNTGNPRVLERESIKISKAAVRQGEFVYTGWRHAEIMIEMREAGLNPVSQDDQGFVDQEGFFYRRIAADTIVRMNDQAKISGSILTSEDLWDRDGNVR